VSEFPASGGWRRYLCSTKEILEAYTATTQGIHTSLACFDKDKPLTINEAALIADRIREGRLLIHQVLARRKHHKRMRQMMRLHILQRDRLLKLAALNKLPVEMIKGWCKTYSGSATPGVNTIVKRGGADAAPTEIGN